MPMMFAVALMIFVGAWYGSSYPSSRAAQHEDARGYAQHVLLYHAAASRACRPPALCPPGAVDAARIQAQLSDTRRNRGHYADGRVRSYMRGNMLVTYYVHPDGGVAAGFHARVASEMMELVPPGVRPWAGVYDAVNGTVKDRNLVVWVSGAATQVGTRLEGIDILNAAVPDMAPVIVSRM